MALRVKATHQLNGPLDNFNVLASRICPDWDSATQTWITRATSNPASIYRHVLQSPSNPKAVADAALDLDLLQDWAEFCADKALTYNGVLDDNGRTLRDVLAEVAAAGRATPRHDGVTWGVVIDRPDADALIVDHINPRNSWNFRWSRAYTQPPHAFVVRFNDAANDYKPTQRTVRWPGYVGEITLTEELPMPGKVHADEVWREARRRQLEIIHRPDTYEATQAGGLRVATRGDDVMQNHDVISRVQVAAQVTSVTGQIVVLDEVITPLDGESNAIRFRVFADDEDTIGTSVVRPVEIVTTAAQTSATMLKLTGSGDVPAPGDLVHFGPVTNESSHLIVRAVEATEDMHSIMRLVDAAPQIDTILDATPIPAWSSRIGAELDPNTLLPSAPRFTRVASGIAGTGTADQVDFLIVPGSGAVGTATFEIDHRLQGAPSWTTLRQSAANGGGTLDDYATGNVIELRGRGVSATGYAGPYSAVLTLTVGAADAGIPNALETAAISITTLLGGALVQFATGTDGNTEQVQLYLSMTPTLDRESDAWGGLLAVTPQQTVAATLGDTTRLNIAQNGEFSSVGIWEVDDDWTIADGVATKIAGASNRDLEQVTTEIADGDIVRTGLTGTDITGGNVRVRLDGDTNADSDLLSADGEIVSRITAPDNTDKIKIVGTSTFAGKVDGLVVYIETAACLDQGTHYLWLEPQNADGVPGPASGPFTITII